MLLNNTEYINSIDRNLIRISDISQLKNKTILISGATGLVCSYIIDMLMRYNKNSESKINIIALGRNEKKARDRFEKYFDREHFQFIQQDIIEFNYDCKCDFIIHGASNAYPKAYDEEPVETMNANYMGTNNLLKLAVKNPKCKFLFISSGEVYGERDTNEGVDENFMGFIDYHNPRSCYPVSKLASETLSVSYAKQFNIHINIARLCHTFGPTMNNSDNRVVNQFIRNALNKEQIIMKSSGSKVRSYCYVADASVAILTILISGENCQVYNIANEKSVISISDIADLCGKLVDKEVIIRNIEEKGSTKIEKSVLNGDKLVRLGMSYKYDMSEGIEETYKILTNQ